MKRKEDKGSVSFDFTEELDMAIEEITEILFTYRPESAEARRQIRGAIRAYGDTIYSNWLGEFSDRTSQMANENSSNVISAILAGITVGKKGTGDRVVDVGLYDDRVRYIVKETSSDEEAFQKASAWRKNKYGVAIDEIDLNSVRLLVDCFEEGVAQL
jgi:hypothetical protein